MVNRRLTDKLLASIAINPQFIDFPFANVLNLGVKIIDCGFLAILANNLSFNQPINHQLTID